MEIKVTLSYDTVRNPTRYITVELPPHVDTFVESLTRLLNAVADKVRG